MIEAGSFVRADRVPQMAGSAEVLAELGDLDVRLPVLTPNLRGLDDAVAAGAREVAVFLSATESFSESNLGAPKAKAEAAILRNFVWKAAGSAARRSPNAVSKTSRMVRPRSSAWPALVMCALRRVFGGG